MYKIGLSSCGKKLDKKLFMEFSKNEIVEIEISEHNYVGFCYKEIYELSKQHGINLWSLHLPFWFNDISSLDRAEREHTLNVFSEIINKASDIGVDKFVVHPSSEPIADSDRVERMKYSKESLSKLADFCENNGAVICVENLPRTCLGHSISEMKMLMESDSRLKMCFDTNHIIVDKPEDIIRAFDDKIVTVHISDFDFVDERHWLPGEGQINWEIVLKSLEQIAYDGAFMYEISYECPDTISRGRALTAKDFAENAKQLFSGKKITFPWVIGGRLQ